MYEEHTAANDEIKSLRYVDDILLVISNAIEKNILKCYSNTLNLNKI